MHLLLLLLLTGLLHRPSMEFESGHNLSSCLPANTWMHDDTGSQGIIIETPLQQSSYLTNILSNSSLMQQVRSLKFFKLSRHHTPHHASIFLMHNSEKSLLLEANVSHPVAAICIEKPLLLVKFFLLFAIDQQYFLHSVLSAAGGDFIGGHIAWPATSRSTEFAWAILLVDLSLRKLLWMPLILALRSRAFAIVTI